MDKTDRAILSILQEDATLPVADIARRVGLSTTPCWRRIQKLEEDKVIVRRVALLDPGKVNTNVTVFVSIKTDQHNEEWLKRSSEVITKFPEVTEFYRMSGDIDYLLRWLFRILPLMTNSTKGWSQASRLTMYQARSRWNG